MADMLTHWSRAGMVLVAAAAIAGCATRPPAPATVPAPAVTPTPSVLAYQSAASVAAELKALGIDCGGWRQVSNPIGATERGSCFVGANEVVISIFQTPEQAAAEPAKKAMFLAGVSDVVMVVGQNWTASCDDAALCGRISEKTKARLEVIPA